MRTLVVTCAGALIAALAGPAAADGVADSKALIEKYSKLPSFVAPGPAFDAKACMKDKKIFAIPLTDDNPFEVAILGGMQNAAKIVGFDFHAWQTQLSPDQWTQGIQQGCRGALQSDRSRRRPAA
jgi:ribose transport system substrate-binding protein